MRIARLLPLLACPACGSDEADGGDDHDSDPSAEADTDTDTDTDSDTDDGKDPVRPIAESAGFHIDGPTGERFFGIGMDFLRAPDGTTTLWIGRPDVPRGGQADAVAWDEWPTDTHRECADSLQFGDDIVASGDFDGDGWDDLVVAGSPSDTDGVWIFASPVDGQQTTADADTVLFSDRLGTLGSIALDEVGDVDDDGHDDLVVRVAGAATYYVAGPLSGTLDLSSEALEIATAKSYTSVGPVLSLDFDGDGVTDVAESVSDDRNGDRVLALALGPLASFVPETYDCLWEENNVGMEITAGDLDGDGTDDLVATVDDRVAGFSKASSRQGTALTAADWVLDADGGAYGSYWPGRHLLRGDVDADGQSDLVWADQVDDQLVIVLGPVDCTGNVSTCRARVYRGDGGSLGTSVAVGDLDANGALDVAVSADDGPLFVITPALDWE